MDKYVIITPVKNEEAYLELTIKSVINQTVKPTQWVIVDDGSTDRTPEIIEKYSRECFWIKGVFGSDRGPRLPGVRHIKAFYQGYSQLDDETWDFIVKMDGDLSFGEDYFEKCFARFHDAPRLGIGGGVIINVTKAGLVPEKQPLFHVRGATKIYSHRCWNAIGGLFTLPSYDTLDEVKAHMLGFETRSFPDLPLTHHRYTGSAYGKWGGSVKNGVSDYISGYHPLFFASKCLTRFLLKPYSIDAWGHLYGYLSAFLKKTPQVPDSALIKYLRQQQLRKLTFRTTIWR
jgi:poly-beta-1,6-N-acetyl-D-glucosamine synthase